MYMSLNNYNIPLFILWSISLWQYLKQCVTNVVLEFLKPENILKLKIAIFVHKFIYYRDGVPSMFLEFFSLASHTYNYNTTQSKILNYQQFVQTMVNLHFNFMPLEYGNLYQNK